MPKAKKTGQVLIIEDEQDLQQFSSWVLEAEGYKTLRAADGEEGISLAKGNRLALILLDIKMPNRYGWSVLAELKNTPELSSIPVIIFTASADISYKNAALRMGAVDYLVKPVSAETLRECVNRVFTHTLPAATTRTKAA